MLFGFLILAFYYLLHAWIPLLCMLIVDLITNLASGQGTTVEVLINVHCPYENKNNSRNKNSLENCSYAFHTGIAIHVFIEYHLLSSRQYKRSIKIPMAHHLQLPTVWTLAGFLRNIFPSESNMTAWCKVFLCTSLSLHPCMLRIRYPTLPAQNRALPLSLKAARKLIWPLICRAIMQNWNCITLQLKGG